MIERPQTQPSTRLKRWRKKFAHAIRGLVVGVRGQDSFWVHLPALLAVIVWAAWLQVSSLRWLLLVVCIAIVLSAELFNSAIEHLARAITDEQHPEIRDALDIASGAVLIVSVGAAVVGMVVLVGPLWQWLSS